jgi:hypothetical protein
MSLLSIQRISNHHILSLDCGCTGPLADHHVPGGHPERGHQLAQQRPSNPAHFQQLRGDQRQRLQAAGQGESAQARVLR